MGNSHPYYYRVGDPNSGASVFKKEYIFSSINAQQYIKEVICNNHVWNELSTAWNFSNWHTHCDAFNVMVGCSVKNMEADLYKKIKRICKGKAMCALTAPISLQQKMRGVMFRISPYFAARVINMFRIRKFAKANVNKCKNGGGKIIRLETAFFIPVYKCYVA